MNSGLAALLINSGLAALLALCAPAPGPAASQELALRSADGTHVARIAQLTDDPRPARRELWQLIVLEDRGERGMRRLWSIVCPEPDPASTYLLADDGSAVCRVDPRFDPEADLVEVWRKGRRAGGFGARELALQLDEDALLAETPRWIAPASDTLRTRELRFGTSSVDTLLDLLALDGALRTIDLSNNRVVVSADANGSGIRVAPPVPTDLDVALDKVTIRSWSAPEEVPGASDFTVRIRGTFPTPGWRIVGFGVELLEPDVDAPLIAITPYAAPVEGGGVAQIITHFDSNCTLNIARGGRYRLEVHGRETPEITRSLNVLPTVLFVSLEQSGGIAGIEHEIVVHRDGRLRSDGRVSLVPTDAFAELVQLVAALPPEPREERSQGNDFFQYDLAWVANDSIVRASFDDGTLVDPWRSVVLYLARLVASPDQEPEPVQSGYRIDDTASTLLVRTGTSGLLKPLAHKHTIRVGSFGGEIVADPDAIEDASVILIVEAPSLRVIEEKNEADTRVIEKKLHEQVLESAKHAQIVFRSTKVAAKELGGGRFEAVIEGELSLYGTLRTTKLSVHIEFTDDELRARGKASIRLSDYGIRPPKALGGTINVADKVELRFDIVAR